MDMIFSWVDERKLIAAGTVLVASASVTVFLLKKYRDRSVRRCPDQTSFRNKVFLITGGSSGLGRELALEVVKRNGTTIIASPSSARGAQAIEYIKRHCGKSDVDVTWMELHLDCLQSVRDFAEAFQAQFGRLDCLVNNAGIMFAPFSLSADGIESHFAINHLGHVCLTEGLLPLLQKSSPSRILFVTSSKYAMASMSSFKNLTTVDGYKPSIAYARSKLATVLYAKNLANRMQSARSDVAVHLIRPGFVRNTKLGRHVSNFLQCLASPLMWFFSITPQQAVQNFLYCCTAKLLSGAMYCNCEICPFDYSLVNKNNEELMDSMSRSMVQEILSNR